MHPIDMRPSSSFDECVEFGVRQQSKPRGNGGPIGNVEENRRPAGPSCGRPNSGTCRFLRERVLGAISFLCLLCVGFHLFPYGFLVFCFYFIFISFLNNIWFSVFFFNGFFFLNFQQFYFWVSASILLNWFSSFFSFFFNTSLLFPYTLYTFSIHQNIIYKSFICKCMITFLNICLDVYIFIHIVHFPYTFEALFYTHLEKFKYMFLNIF